VPDLTRGQYNPQRGRGGRGGQYGRGGPSRIPPPENLDEEYESTSNFGNFNFLKSCPKGIITSTSEASKWLWQCVEKRNLREGDIFPAARDSNNVFNVLVQKDYLVLFDISYEHSLVESNRRSNEITAIFHPVNIYPHHDSLAVNLPTPEFDLNSIMLHFPQLYFANAKIKYTINLDCRCLNESQNLSTTYITSPICLKKESAVRGSDYQFTSTPVIQRWHSVTKTYENVSKDPFMRDYRCLVPQPFPVNCRWSSCHFVPSFHGKVLSKKATYFYSISDPRFRKQAANFFDSEPRHWSHDSHPLLAEPCEGTELSFHAANLYGCESIPRVSLSVFPTAYDFFISLSNVTDNLTMEEIPVTDPCSVEQFLLKERENFLLGKETISCPVCPPLFSSTGKISVVRYRRGEYIVHYRENHFNVISFVASELGTGGGQRCYETCLLYFFALAHEAVSPDSELGLTEFNSDSIVPYSNASVALGVSSSQSSKIRKGKGKEKRAPPSEKGLSSPPETYLDDAFETENLSPDPPRRTPTPSEAIVMSEGLPQREK